MAKMKHKGATIRRPSKFLRDSDGKMGHTSHLSKPELGALVSYVQSL